MGSVIDLEWSPPASVMPTPTLYASPMHVDADTPMHLESPPTPSTPLRRAAVRSRAFHVKDGYALTGRVLGTGAYATVLEAHWSAPASDGSMPAPVRVAIKVVEVSTDFFEAVRSLREIKVLKFLAGCPTAAQLLDGWMYGAHMYLVLPAYEFTLHGVLNDLTVVLTEDHVRRIALHLLRAVAYMHHGGVLHRDIKPYNILLRGDCSLGLCDFNLARPAGRTRGGERMTPLTPFAALPQMSNSVVTRWYRAPEVLLDEPYSYAVDMWAVGATLAEVVLRRPLWPSRSDTHQLQMYVQTLGTPAEADVGEWGAATRARLATLPPSSEITTLPTDYAGLNDLLRRIFVWQPSLRITARQALAHPWLAGAVTPMPLPTATMDDAYEAELAPRERRADVMAAIRAELADL